MRHIHYFQTPNVTDRPVTQTALSPTMRLLAVDEPPAVSVEQAGGVSDFVLACDHASRRIPRALGTLGLPEAELSSHCAWDIGAAAVAKQLARMLDAPLVLQNYSRLVIDCNRPAGAADSIPLRSEWSPIGGNGQLGAAAIAVRTEEIFTPYHDALRAILDQRQREGRPALLVAVHSFTPAYLGTSRPWHVGVMHQRDARMARDLLKRLRRDEHLCVGDNEPYSMGDDTDYTLPVHGESRRVPHAGLEIRQDLIADQAGQDAWARRLATLFKQMAPGMLADA